MERASPQWQSAELARKGVGGEGGIRTHVPELPDHPISSRRRYDHFGTSPVNLKILPVYLSNSTVNLRKISCAEARNQARNAFVKGSQEEIFVYSSASEKGMSQE